ncbi:MAG: NAD(P)H-hydrate dehydratase [Candidatus Eisenbacteria bacterium]
MIPVLTAEEMRSIDKETIRNHVPGIKLMENAGKGVAEEIIKNIKPRKASAIVIICGKDNNGGDGFVVARLLKQKGYRPRVYLLGKSSQVKGDAEANLKRCVRNRIKITEVDRGGLSALEETLAGAHVIVDAIFGTGFAGSPRGLSRDVIEIINGCPAPTVAVDIPSGVNASTGEATLAVEADITVTMALPKRGHLLFPGRALSGELIVHDIGVPPEVIVTSNPDTFVLTKPDIQAALPERSPQAHKWTCGSVAAICGSTGFTGAAALTSVSALRVGAGVVTLAIPRSLNAVMEMKLTEVMTLPVDETPEGTLALTAKQQLMSLIKKVDAVAIGPGLSQNDETVSLIQELLPRVGRPCVLDADGINAFAGDAGKLKGLKFPLVITPHAGEASRLLGIDKRDIVSQPIDFARSVARDLGVVMVLKGAPTVIADPDGDVFINPMGNQGLATAGSGDVLTGIIAGLLAQKVSPVEAACSGVFIHGLLGDMLLEERGYFGYLAGELSAMIPEALATMVLE